MSVVQAPNVRRAAKNILDGISDPQNRKWRVVSVNGSGYRPHGWEIMVGVTGGTIRVDRDGWVRFEATDPAAPVTGTHALTVIAEADDGPALYTSQKSVVLERGEGTRLTTTVTVTLSGVAQTWSPLDLSPAFWLSPLVSATHVLSDYPDTLDDTKYQRVSVKGFTDAAGGARTLSDLAPPTDFDDVSSVELTTGAFNPILRPFAFDAAVTARTIVAVVGHRRSAGWSGHKLLEAGAISIGEASRTLTISGATGTVRVGGRAAADEELSYRDYQVVAVTLDAAQDWTGIPAGNVVFREMAMFAGALSQADLEKVEGYFAWRHDLVWTLRDDHPYRWRPVNGSAFDPTSTPAAVTFGGATQAGHGGVLVKAGATITAGDPSSHWEIKYGRLVPTAAFVSAAPAATTTYTLTIGGEECVVTVGAASMRHVATGTELRRALNAVKNTATPVTIRLRDGFYQAAREIEMGGGATAEIVVEPDNPGRIISHGVNGRDSADQIHAKDLRCHWPHVRVKKEGSGDGRHYSFDGTATRVEAHGYHLDWVWGATEGNWDTYGYGVYSCFFAKIAHQCYVHDGNTFGSVTESYGCTTVNLTADGPASIAVCEDYLVGDCPYDSSLTSEGSNHSDVFAQNRGTPQKVDWTNSIYIDSPINPGQDQRVIFFEAAGGQNSPGQNYGRVSNVVLFGATFDAAFGFNEKAMPGLITERNALVVTRGSPAGRVKSLQGGKHVTTNSLASVMDQTGTVLVTDFGDAFTDPTIPTDRPLTRYDVMRALRPRAGGPLDLGGGDYAGPVLPDGTWATDIEPLTSAVGEPAVPTLAATATGVTLTCSAPTDDGGGVASWEVAWVEPKGTNFISRPKYDLPADRWIWDADDLPEGLWSKRTGYTSGDDFPVAGNRTLIFAVRPVSTAGWKGCWSQNATIALGVTPPAYDAAPLVSGGVGKITVSGVDEQTGGSAVTSRDLRWSPAGAGTWTTVTGVTFPAAVSGLSAETAYDVQVRAVSAEGIGPWSETGAATTLEAGQLLIATHLYYQDPPSVNITSFTWDIGVSIAADSQIIYAVQWQSQAIASPTLVAQNSDGSNAVTMTALGSYIDVSSGNRKQLFRAAAGAGWTDLSIVGTWASATRMSPMGGVVEVSETADFTSAVVTGNTTAAQNPTADVTTAAGVLAVFGMHWLDAATDPASVSQEAFAGDVAFRRNGGQRLGTISAVQLSTAESPAAQTITRTASPAFSTTVNIAQAGVIAVMVPA